jgi:hypothetical protein
MKPAPDQDLAKLKPLSPLFSGELSETLLPVPPEGDEFRFSDEDRRAVEGVLNQQPAGGDDS